MSAYPQFDGNVYYRLTDSGHIMSVFSVLAINSQTLRAALANSVDSLKNE